MKIGIFDSGLGGLIVSKELQKAFPQQEFVFIADSINFPYGTKSDDELQVAIADIIHALEEMDADIIIVACNTASSIIERYDLQSRAQLITIIGPTVDYAIQHRKWDQYLVLATTSTVESQIYCDKLQQRAQEVIEYDSQSLVSLVESGKYRQSEAMDTLRTHFGDLPDDDHFNIILGCTHFILLEEQIANLFPNSMMVTPIRPLQQMLQDILTTQSTAHASTARGGGLEIYTTGDPISFVAHVRLLMDDVQVKKLHLPPSHVLIQGAKK